MNIPLTIKTLLVLVILNVSPFLYAQNRETAKEIITQLCSDDFAGRGYLEQGDLKAANYISGLFGKIGLSSLTDGYKHQFLLNVNTFPKAIVSIDGKELNPGYDFLVAPNSASAVGERDIFYVSPRMLTSSKVAKKVKKALKKGFIPVISIFDSKDKILSENFQEIKKCNKGATLVVLKESLTWSVSMEQAKEAEIWLVDSIFDRFSKQISFNIKSEFKQDYESQNILGFVPGTEYPDSFIIFCGHYDHLGKMGDAIFYGANDNASGIAMLVDMATYFNENPQKYSVAFVAFGAEEAGLVGSYSYVKDPIIPLSKTKFLFNMDLMGSGEDGATIVNGTIYKEDFERLKKINSDHDYLSSIKARGKAANSDHYFFSEAGVPSFFIYLRGKYTYYHSPADNNDNLKLGEYYDRSFLLIRDFIISINE